MPPSGFLDAHGYPALMGAVWTRRHPGGISVD